MSSSAAEAFPWEVLENIVDSCHVRGEPDYATLQQVALTCHGLLPQARASLFRHVRLRTHEKLEQFLEAIEENRMLEGLVKELTITPRDTKPFFAPFASMSQRLRRLRAMSLSVDPTLSTPYHAPRTLRFTAVAFLKLSNVTFSSQGDFMRLLWMFPELRLLQLGVVEFKKKPQKSEMTPPVVRPLTGAALAKLEIVDILVPNLSPLELMRTLGYTPDSPFIQLSARSGGENQVKDPRQGVRRAEPNRPKQDTVGPFIDEICLSYGFPAGDNSKKVKVHLPLGYLPQVYGEPHVLPKAGAELRGLLADYVLHLYRASRRLIGHVQAVSVLGWDILWTYIVERTRNTIFRWQVSPDYVSSTNHARIDSAKSPSNSAALVLDPTTSQEGLGLLLLILRVYQLRYTPRYYPHPNYLATTLPPISFRDHPPAKQKPYDSPIDLNCNTSKVIPTPHRLSHHTGSVRASSGPHRRLRHVDGTEKIATGTLHSAYPIVEVMTMRVDLYFYPLGNCLDGYRDIAIVVWIAPVFPPQKIDCMDSSCGTSLHLPGCSSAGVAGMKPLRSEEDTVGHSVAATQKETGWQPRPSQPWAKTCTPPASGLGKEPASKICEPWNGERWGSIQRHGIAAH